jgi:hypothetical protein
MLCASTCRCCSCHQCHWSQTAQRSIERNFSIFFFEAIPSFVAFSAPAIGGPGRPLKMTSDECYDDVRWRPSVLKVALLGNNCVISATGSSRKPDFAQFAGAHWRSLSGWFTRGATGFGSKSIAAFSLLKRNFCAFAKGDCCVSRACCICRGFRLTLNDGAVAARYRYERRDSLFFIDFVVKFAGRSRMVRPFALARISARLAGNSRMARFNCPLKPNGPLTNMAQNRANEQYLLQYELFPCYQIRHSSHGTCEIGILINSWIRAVWPRCWIPVAFVGGFARRTCKRSGSFPR